MKLLRNYFIVLLLLSTSYAQIIIDHNCTKLDSIPTAWIETAKSNLHVAYGHTSHGSQLTTGLAGLITFRGTLYNVNDTGADGALELRDSPFIGAEDLGSPNLTAWGTATRNYLDANPTINVIMWAWCGQLGSMNEQETNIYLNLMNDLETEYPSVHFIYMTGHLNGSGLEGVLHANNEQIRNFCQTNNKTLYDFADIETYDPDGNYYGDMHPNDNCDYDSDHNYVYDSNWAIEWQDANPGEWYDCESAHSQPLNANLKAYATWWLWARIAGWDGNTGEPASITVDQITTIDFALNQNYPNPFNPSTVISYRLSDISDVNLSIYNLQGQKVATLVNERQTAGDYQIEWNADQLSSGVYLYKIEVGKFQQIKKMMLIK